VDGGSERRCRSASTPEPIGSDFHHSTASPAVDRAVAVGGTATSLGQVLGSALDHAALERGIALLTASSVDSLAGRLGLDPERVRLLPAGILVLQALSDRLGPLQIACGGLREGVILELAEQAAELS
jgi:exopolyphosphatase / guanosine-5'-triphosphate,3'-diphosphate pyrophosphatase